LDTNFIINSACIRRTRQRIRSDTQSLHTSTLRSHIWLDITYMNFKVQNMQPTTIFIGHEFNSTIWYKPMSISFLPSWEIKPHLHGAALKHIPTQ